MRVCNAIWGDGVRAAGLWLVEVIPDHTLRGELLMLKKTSACPLRPIIMDLREQGLKVIPVVGRMVLQ